MTDQRRAKCKPALHSVSSNEPLIDNSFVCAIAAASINHARRLRTYDRSTIGECTIVEVARATSAAPTFFEPAEITINGTKERFVDGALGFNNPAWELYAEAKTVFPGRNIDCLVSLGTGSTIRGSLRQPRLWERIIPKNVIDALKLVTVNCEHIHERMLQHFEHELDIYFRFNVDAGLEGIRLQEWQKLSEVQSVTIDYLTGFAVKSRLTKAAALLKQPPIQSRKFQPPRILFCQPSHYGCYSLLKTFACPKRNDKSTTDAYTLTRDPRIPKSGS